MVNVMTEFEIAYRSELFIRHTLVDLGSFIENFLPGFEITFHLIAEIFISLLI